MHMQRIMPTRPSPPLPCLLPAGLMASLVKLLADCSKLDLAAFTASLGTAEAALRCAVAAGAAAIAPGSPATLRTTLWGDLLPAAFKTIRKLGEWVAMGACKRILCVWRRAAMVSGAVYGVPWNASVPSRVPTPATLLAPSPYS